MDSNVNVDVIYNRHQFQLRLGVHRNQELQLDWNRWGEDRFSFEVLEKLEDIDELTPAVYEQLKALKEKWIAKLQPFGEHGYNRRPQ
ncbi:GIY-YIG nuclease family protein [Brevibacillus sp. H7]|uniref:GIY-YIG nuclease family protein n=1 Tax=Brevibacillus sp. H7 TaxID=3349138 RepID=UPI0037F1CBCA